MGEQTTAERKRRVANLRRKKRTVITGLAHGDIVTAVWDAERWEWRLVVESSNGVKIDHETLTPPPAAA